MPDDSHDASRPLRRIDLEVAVYVAAGVAYVTLGVLYPPLLFSWLVGAGFLVLCVIIVPIAARVWRR